MQEILWSSWTVHCRRSGNLDSPKFKQRAKAKSCEIRNSVWTDSMYIIHVLKIFSWYHIWFFRHYTLWLLPWWNHEILYLAGWSSRLLYIFLFFLSNIIYVVWEFCMNNAFLAGDIFIPLANEYLVLETTWEEWREDERGRFVNFHFIFFLL